MIAVTHPSKPKSGLPGTPVATGSHDIAVIGCDQKTMIISIDHD
jgi:adenine deaminase